MNTPCIEWEHHRTSLGYGRIRRKGKNYLVHRIAYCEYHGVSLSSIKGFVIRHRCDNPPCINPTHLEIGTCAENSKDMVIRGRSRAGNAHPKAKLTRDQVIAIRARYVKSSRQDGSIAIARDYGVASVTIRDIISGKLWK